MFDTVKLKAENIVVNPHLLEAINSKVTTYLDRETGSITDVYTFSTPLMFGPALAKAFLNRGCQIYIGPDDYPEGNAALIFILRLFYEIIENKKSVNEAYQIARSMDDKLSMYQIYESDR